MDEGGDCVDVYGVCVCIGVCVCVQVCVCIEVCVCIAVCIGVYVYRYVRMHRCVCVCMQRCVCIVCVCFNRRNMSIYHVFRKSQLRRRRINAKSC